MHAETETRTLLFQEAAEAPAAVDRMQRALRDRFHRLGARLKDLAPRLVVTCARGSSDFAATYAKYLIESRALAICASAAPSISSVYGSTLPAAGSVCLAISQSGRSPDILRSVKAFKASGAFVVALVNDEASPLAAIADEALPLCAGPEKSVAATKSFITALAAIAEIVARWAGDEELDLALREAPERLAEAFALDWRLEPLKAATNLYVLGRGVGYAAAQEAALKLKEIALIHAEAYSAAEVLHGPAALVREGFPILAFAQGDETAAGMADILFRLAEKGAAVLSAGATSPQASALPTLRAHPALQPMLSIQSFYRAANRLALLRGCDPDRPPNLSKITETV